MSAADTSSFKKEDVIAGVAFDENACKAATSSVRVEVDGKPDCLRYYLSVGGGANKRPLIYLSGDVVESGNKQRNDVRIADWYLRLSPALYQNQATQWASAMSRPVVHIGRPGAFGSSGDHLERRRPREVALINAAISTLKANFGWDRIDMVGQSGGGHLIAALLAHRSDIDCAIIASGNVAVKQRLHSMNWPTDVDVTGHADFVDPIDGVDEIVKHPPRRVIMLSDPNDRIVPIASQSAFVDKLGKAGVAVEHRLTLAFDPNRHDLTTMAIVAAASCQ